jgi:hypothetical protein
MFHLGDLAYRILSIKFVHLNSRRAKVSRKVGNMRAFVMGRVMVLLIRWFFRRRVLGTA